MKGLPESVLLQKRKRALNAVRFNVRITKLSRGIGGIAGLADKVKPEETVGGSGGGWSLKTLPEMQIAASRYWKTLAGRSHSVEFDVYKELHLRIARALQVS